MFGDDTIISSIANADIIADFTRGEDGVELSAKVFSKLSSGTLDAKHFTANKGGKAKDADDYIVYNTETGQLFYDADGNGVGKAQIFARLQNKAVLTAADIKVLGSGSDSDDNTEPPATSNEFLVNTYTQNNQHCSAITTLNDGSFVVVWQTFGHLRSAFCSERYKGG